MQHRISLNTILSLLLALLLLTGTLAACQPNTPPEGTTTEQDTADPDATEGEDSTASGEDTPGEEQTTGDDILQPDDPTYDVAKQFKDVLISAVYGTGQNKDAAVGHGFIQLYNVGTERVSLKDAALYYREDTGDDYRQFAFAEDASIAPGGFYLIRMQAARENNGETYDESFAVLSIDSYDAEWAVILDNKDMQISLAPAGQKIDKDTAVEEINGTVSYFVAAELGYDSHYAVDNMSKSKVAVRTALKTYSGFHKVNLNEATTAQLQQVCPESGQGKNTVIGSRVNEVLFSADAGVYAQGFWLELSAKEGYKIYYTTDGTDPKTNGKEYTASIPLADSSAVAPGPTIKGGAGHGFGSHSNSLPGGYVIKAYATNGTESTDVFTNTYFISETFYEYGVSLLSLSMDKSLIYGSQGFYTNFSSTGGTPNQRQTGMLEVFSSDGVRHGSSYVELAISGHGSSGWPMKSMRVYYKSANNTAVGTDGDLNYDLFDGYARDDQGHAITDFSRLLLRNSGNDCMDSYIRDAYMQRVSRDLDVYTMAYAPVLLFINGEFWGVYNARERYSPEYVESHTGANKDTVALIESDYDALVLGGDPGAPYIPMDGTQADADEFNALVDYIRSHDLSVQEHYDYVAERLDVNSFMDMYVSRLFFNARDWPENNIKVFKNRNPEDPSGQDTKWYFSLLDMDMGISMYPAGHGADTSERANFFGWIDSTSTVVGTIMHGLCKNAGFKQTFISRFAYVVDRIYTPEYLEAELDAVVAQRQPLVELQTKRWGASENQYRYSVDNMYSFVRNRAQYVIPMLCSYFHISPEDLQIGTEKRITVTFNAERAEVTFNGEAVKESGTEYVFEVGQGSQNVTFTVEAAAKQGYSVSSIAFMPTSGEIKTATGSKAEFTVSSSGTLIVNTKSNGAQSPVAGVQSGITASAHSSYYLTETGDLYAWGLNENGILGIPGNGRISMPTLVASNVAKVEVCHSNDAENNNNATMMAYLTLDGQLYTVGANSAGQLGRNGTAADDRPGLVKFDKKIVDVSVGHDHMLVLDEEGVLWGVGSNTYGQLGKSNEGGTTSKFQMVASGVKLIAAGRRNTFYTDQNNVCYVLGDNRWQKFGTDADRYNTPHHLLSNVAYMSTGEHQIVLVTTGGDLYYAGWRTLSGWGQGTGSGGAVKLTGGVKKAVLHHSNMLILKTDGSVWGYGSNAGGALGSVSATSGNPGKMIAGGVKDIASGYQFSLFLLEDGTIFAQGDNASGQAGNGKTGGSVNMAQALF